MRERQALSSAPAAPHDRASLAAARASPVPAGILATPVRLGVAALQLALDRDRKSTRLNSSHANISTLSLHDALPISPVAWQRADPYRRRGGSGYPCASDRR